MAIYTVRLTWGETFQFSADLAQASAPILNIDEDGEKSSTPFQTADARHREHDAARLLLSWFGAEYWLAPDVDEGQDEDGNATYDGMPEDEYLDSLIESVE